VYQETAKLKPLEQKKDGNQANRERAINKEEDNIKNWY